MNKENNSWFNKLESLIQEKHMLSHPFYQAWTCGMLEKSTLQNYAKEYYQHVKAFPTYISALHSRCEDTKVRKELLANLIDEEVGNPNHLDLWRNFAIGLGVDEEELDGHQPKKMTRDLINTFRNLCNTGSVVHGLTALYCYESQIPPICHTKVEGLKKWYGLTDPESYRYFTLHETMDIEHSREEKELLLSLVDEKESEAVLASADKTLNALGNFLSSFL